MHKFTRSLLVLAALVALVAIIACAPAAVQPTAAPPTAAAAQPTAAPAQPTAAPAQPTAAPAAGGAADTLVWASNTQDIISLDPAQVYEFSGILAAHSVYDTLVKYVGPDLTTLQPGIAEKWDIKDAGDHWEITFQLKDGLKFSSGNPITSDDVVYSLQRVIALNQPPAFLITDVGKLTPESIKAPDAKTVVLSLPKEASPQAFLTVLTGTIGGIVDSKEVKTHETTVDGKNDFGNTWLKDHSAGSGPYVVDHYTNGVEVLLKANPNAQTQPKTPQILLKNVPDASNQQALLEKGDADIAQNLTPEQITAVNGKDGITTVKANSLLMFYLGMNLKAPPLDKPEVREALRAAIDYDGIVNDLLSGNAVKLQSIIPIGLAGANTDTPFQKDVPKAKELLKQAGLENGFEIEIETYTGNMPGGVSAGDLAAKLQADWAEIGVKATIKQMQQADLLPIYRASNAQIFLGYWGPDFPDADTNATPFSDINAGSIAKRNSYDDAKAIDLAKKGAAELDPTKRTAIYKELTDYVMHNGPYGVLYQPSQLFALRPNVKGFEWNPIGYTDLWTISK